MIKAKNHHIFNIQIQTICIDGQYLKNCLQMYLNGKKEMLKFTEDFKNYNEDRDKGHILKVDVKYPKRLHNGHSNLPFLPERMSLIKKHG